MLRDIIFELLLEELSNFGWKRDAGTMLRVGCLTKSTMGSFMISVWKIDWSMK